MMLGLIGKWFAVKREERRVRRFNDGFDYAAGALLRGDKSPFDLDAEIWIFERDEFDKGMEAAINAAVQRGIVNDNRVSPIGLMRES